MLPNFGIKVKSFDRENTLFVPFLLTPTSNVGTGDNFNNQSALQRIIIGCLINLDPERNLLVTTVLAALP